MGVSLNALTNGWMDIESRSSCKGLIDHYFWIDGYQQCVFCGLTDILLI